MLDRDKSPFETSKTFTLTAVKYAFDLESGVNCQLSMKFVSLAFSFPVSLLLPFLAVFLQNSPIIFPKPTPILGSHFLRSPRRPNEVIYTELGDMKRP